MLACEGDMTTNKGADQVLREFPAIGKYRVRILKGSKGVALDVREYISADTFEGFTRKGIRLSSRAEVEQLLHSLNESMEHFTAPAGATAGGL